MMKKQQEENSPKVENSEAQQKEKYSHRKIPETLVQPYSLINLKDDKKKRFNYKKPEQQQEPTNNAVLKQLKPLFGECECSEDLKQQWTETVYQLTSTLFVLSKVCSFRIRTILKVKIIGFSLLQEDNFRPLVVKITWGEKQEECSNVFVKLHSVDQAIFLFASIVTRKLLLMDFVLVDMSKKVYTSLEGCRKSVEGDIYKVSTFMRKWEKKSAKLDQKLKFFKDEKLNQQIKSVKEVWTRFSMYNGYFVVKMFEGIEKIELGIPLGDYSNIESERNWLVLLTKLIK